MKQDRLIKAQSISKQLVSRYIITELRDLINTHGIITITEVIISSDLGYMDIYVSCMIWKESLTKSLSEYAHIIQRVLWKEIAFVKVPKVRFKYDTSGQDSSEIYTTIKNLNS